MNREELNELFGLTEDDSQQGVVDLVEEGDDTDEGIFENELDEFDEGGEEDEEELEPEDQLVEEDVEGLATPHQSLEDNHRYAAARKEAEAQLRMANQELASARDERDSLMEALSEFGFQGDINQITDALKAQAQGRDVEEITREREEEAIRLREALEKHPDVLAAKEYRKNSILRQQAEELSRIQSKNPDIQSIEQLINMEGTAGTVFRSLIKDGMHIDEAYDIVSGMVPKRMPDDRYDTRSHIRQVNGTQNTPSGEVPKQQYELAKMLMPGVSKKEIQAYYEKTKR